MKDAHEFTASTFLGLPTHQIFTLQHPNFGYSQVGLGAQFDGSYTFHKENQAFLYGTRYLYFVPRHALDTMDNRYKFSSENVFDILVAYKNWWNNHGFEAGYTFRANFGVWVCPRFDDINGFLNYIRSNLYVVYKYNFSIKDIANNLLVSASYGLDHRSTLFGNRYILTLWGAWNVSF